MLGAFRRPACGSLAAQAPLRRYIDVEHRHKGFGRPRAHGLSPLARCVKSAVDGACACLVGGDFAYPCRQPFVPVGPAEYAIVYSQVRVKGGGASST